MSITYFNKYKHLWETLLLVRRFDHMKYVSVFTVSIKLLFVSRNKSNVIYLICEKYVKLFCTMCILKQCYLISKF